MTYPIGASNLIKISPSTLGKVPIETAEEEVEKMAEVSTILSPGLNIRPQVTPELAKELIWRLYKLKVTGIKELNGYDDVNYHVHMEEDEKSYVFKVSNWVDSQTPELFDACNEMMLFLYNQGFVVNTPVKNVDGRLNSLETLKTSEGVAKKNVVRLLTFITGEILYNVPCTNDICFQTGEMAGALDNALQAFHHPFYMTRQTIWMLSNATQVRQFLFAIKDVGRRQMVEKILSEFEDVVLGNIHNLPKGIIHGDINEQNIITRKGENRVWVHGILDFGDTQHNCYLFEAVLATIYMMLLGEQDNFVEFGGHTIAGYLSKRLLSRLEWDLIKICVETRYCQSLVMGAYTNQMDPSNTYVLTTSKKGWDQLTAFRNTPKEKVYEVWRKTIERHNLPSFYYV